MRREIKKTSLSVTVTPCFPVIFWQRCDSCRFEFRRERGYRAELPWGEGEPYSYLCQVCAPNLEAAEKLFAEKPWRTPEPQRPPRYR